MNTIKKIVISEQIINKSRFITSLFPVESPSDALAILKSVKKEYYDATHNCYAYIIGDNSEHIKYSDDKEPSQTAGVVIYEVLKKNNLTNVLCIVTRYFGGVKLGSGGLVRAYSGSAAKAVEAAKIIEIISMTSISITCSYEVLDLIQNYLKDYELTDSVYTDRITLKYLIPESIKDKTIEELINLTKNTITIQF